LKKKSGDRSAAKIGQADDGERIDGANGVSSGRDRANELSISGGREEKGRGGEEADKRVGQGEPEVRVPTDHGTVKEGGVEDQCEADMEAME
jgi:hypothetical protein